MGRVTLTVGSLLNGIARMGISEWRVRPVCSAFIRQNDLDAERAVGFTRSMRQLLPGFMLHQCRSRSVTKTSNGRRDTRFLSTHVAPALYVFDIG